MYPQFNLESTVFLQHVESYRGENMTVNPERTSSGWLVLNAKCVVLTRVIQVNGGGVFTLELKRLVWQAVGEN